MHLAAGIILAGGKSSRMGNDKALLPLGQQSLLATIVDTLRPLLAEIIVVSNSPEAYQDLNVRLVGDIIPNRGPLSGIHAGLAASKYWHNFVVPCDMPFLKGQLVDYLLRQAPGYDVVVPRQGGYLQPLHAVYSQGCLAAIEECLRQGQYKTVAFYPRVKVRYLDVDDLEDINGLEHAFFNINTPEQLDTARCLAGQPPGNNGPALSLAAARDLLLPGLEPRGVEEIKLEAAAGRVLAAAVYAAEPFPPFPRSRVDGYALGAPLETGPGPDREQAGPGSDTASGAGTGSSGAGTGAVFAAGANAAVLDGAGGGEGPLGEGAEGGAGAHAGRYRLLGSIAAGSDAAISLGPGTAAAIFTGARLPAGTVTVVPREIVTCRGQYISVSRLPGASYIEPAAAQVAAGEEVLAAGTVLGAAEIGLLAALGRREVGVYRRPRVLLAASGNELAEPGSGPAPEAHIYNSNYYALAAAAATDGAEVIPLGILPDDLERQAAVYRQALASGDLLLASGGAGGGNYDFTAAAFAKAGGKLVFTRLNICPGRRVVAARASHKLLLGLPGNPPAALVVYYLLAAPLIRALAGKPAAAPIFPARLAAAVDRVRPQRAFIWARAEPGAGGWQVTPLPRWPGGIRAAAGANALIDLPPGAAPAVGDEVQVLLLNPTSHLSLNTSYNRGGFSR